MILFSIASGSSGNCICVGSGDTYILIDAGISGKRVREGLNSRGLKVSDCQAILVTHEHSDHISGLGVLSRRYGLGIYSTPGTVSAIKASSSLGEIDEALFHEIAPEESFSIGGLVICPHRVSHDAADPVCYTFSDGKRSAGVVTDLGKYDDRIKESIRYLNTILLEANHDIRMLQVGRYPYNLKRRIMGEKGHLSNEMCGQLLSEVLHDGVEHILLGHLSEENNYPDLALEAVRQEISLGDNPFHGSDFDIQIAPRHNPSEVFEI